MHFSRVKNVSLSRSGGETPVVQAQNFSDKKHEERKPL